jgi:hypothetical protein
VLLMVTSQPELLLDTILSRCIRIYLKGPRGGLPHGEAAGNGCWRRCGLILKADAKGIPAAMGLMGTFTEVLKDEKAAIGKRHDEA